MHGMLAGPYYFTGPTRSGNHENAQQQQQQQQQQYDLGSDKSSDSKHTTKASPLAASMHTSNLPDLLNRGQNSGPSSLSKLGGELVAGEARHAALAQSRTMPLRQRTRDLSGSGPFIMDPASHASLPAPSNIEMVRYLICDLKLLGLLRCYEPLCQPVQDSAEVYGYEMYIVEQWACERKLNSCIMTFTGNPKHKVVTGIVALPQDTKYWNPFTQSYFDELFKTHARPKTTDLGHIYVSNLSSFPSNLNLVPVPGGNIRELWGLFDINENLKRTGCGGRLVLSLSMPSNASEDKFRQLFKTHENVSLDFSVRELVTLVQIGLFYYKLLSPQYVDGLLCNETMTAINLWWDRFGSKKYGHRYRPPTSEHHLLTPRTVAAIIGCTTGIRNRISTIIGSSKAPKDPFDVEFFVESLRQFQKHEHLLRTMRLDDATVDSLYSQTGSKGTNSDFFGIVKSTMKEVSGKTYQGITDVETLDIDRLRNNLQGPRARYLWLARGERRSLVQPTPNALSMGIPLESLSQSELTSSNDFKWSDIARRTIPRGKKDPHSVMVPNISVLPEGQFQAAPVETIFDPPQLSLPPQGMPETEHAQFVNLEDFMEDGRLHLHRHHHHHRDKTPRREKLKRVINRSPNRREYERTGAEGRESEDSDYYLNADVSDATASVTDDELQKVYRRRQSNLKEAEVEEEDPSEANVAAFDVDLTPELRRRHSIDGGDLLSKVRRHRKASSASYLQVPLPLRRDNSLAISSSPYHLGALRRCHSFSIVEDCLFRQTALPWAVPASVMARHYNNAIQLQTIIKAQTRSMRSQQEKYDKLTRKLAARVKQDKVLANLLERDMHLIYDREKNLKTVLADVETLTARLQYETRMLDAKMRDVEEAVDTFVGKVRKLEDRVRVIVCEMVKTEEGSKLMKESDLMAATTSADKADISTLCLELDKRPHSSTPSKRLLLLQNEKDVALDPTFPATKVPGSTTAAGEPEATPSESWYSFCRKFITF